MFNKFIKWIGDQALAKGGELSILNKVQFNLSDFSSNTDAVLATIKSLVSDNLIKHEQLDPRYPGPMNDANGQPIPIHTVTLTEKGIQRYLQIKESEKEPPEPRRVGFETL